MPSLFEEQIEHEEIQMSEVQDFGSVPDQLVDAGVRTVLSSGGRVRALEGRQGIEILVRAGLEVVAGSGVQPDQAGMLIPQIGRAHV